MEAILATHEENPSAVVGPVRPDISSPIPLSAAGCRSRHHAPPSCARGRKRRAPASVGGPRRSAGYRDAGPCGRRRLRARRSRSRTGVPRGIPRAPHAMPPSGRVRARFGLDAGRSPGGAAPCRAARPDDGQAASRARKHSQNEDARQGFPGGCTRPILLVINLPDPAQCVARVGVAIVLQRLAH